MGTPPKWAGPTACIVAVRVRKSSRSAAGTAGHQPVSGEQFLMQWLDELEEQEKQAVLDRLFVPLSINTLPSPIHNQNREKHREQHTV